MEQQVQLRLLLNQKRILTQRYLFYVEMFRLLQVAQLKSLLQNLKNHDAVVGTVELESPKGYGRIVRVNNKFSSIVEEKETTPEQRQIREVNTGIIAIQENVLRKYISLIKNNNQKKEYYLQISLKF